MGGSVNTVVMAMTISKVKEKVRTNPIRNVTDISNSLNMSKTSVWRLVAAAGLKNLKTLESNSGVNKRH